MKLFPQRRLNNWRMAVALRRGRVKQHLWHLPFEKRAKHKVLKEISSLYMSESDAGRFVRVNIMNDGIELVEMIEIILCRDLSLENVIGGNIGDSGAVHRKIGLL